MRRREFLKAGAAMATGAALQRDAFARTPFAPKPEAWRTFGITTRVEIAKPCARAQAWLPVPAVDEAEWIRPLGNTWATNAGASELKREAKYGAQLLHAEWTDDESAPVVEVVNRFAIRDRTVDFTKPGTVRPLSEAERNLYTSATELTPTNGIVKMSGQCRGPTSVGPCGP